MTGCQPWPPDLRRPAGTTALLAATRKIPVVFMQVNDPVEQGFVAALAHPADNTTGFTQMSAELDPKRLQLLHDIAPSLSRATFSVNPHLTPGLAARHAQPPLSNPSRNYGSIEAIPETAGERLATRPRIPRSTEWRLWGMCGRWRRQRNDYSVLIASAPWMR